MNKKKILIIANVTWNIYNFRTNLLEALLEDGWSVVVAAKADEYTGFLDQYPAISFIPLKNIKKASVNPLQDILFLMELSRIYKKVKPDLILHYTIKPNIYGGIAARWRGIPYFAVITGLGYSFIHKGWLNQLVMQLYKIALKTSRKVIFENRDDLRKFKSLGIISEDQGVAVNGCGVDTEFYNCEKTFLSRDRIIFTYIGRLLYDKGLKELVEAFKLIKSKYKNAELWLVGKRDKENPAFIKDDDMAEWLEQEGIFYKGYMEDVRPLIEQSHCIVYPSYREGMPRVVLEAMSMQKPVITTDVAGCRDTIIDGVHGFLVEAKAISPLFNAMKHIIETDDIDLAIMGQKSRERVISIFNHKKIASDLIAILNHAIEYDPSEKIYSSSRPGETTH